jgi:hypothetical protein
MMSVIYTWKILGLRTTTTEDRNNIIVGVDWEKTGTENGFKGSYTDFASFPISAVNTDSFVPFEELTEDEVLIWVRNTISGEFETVVDMQIKSQIDSQANQTVAVELPWAAPVANTEGTY